MFCCCIILMETMLLFNAMHLLFVNELNTTYVSIYYICKCFQMDQSVDLIYLWLLPGRGERYFSSNVVFIYKFPHFPSVYVRFLSCLYTCNCLCYFPLKLQLLLHRNLNHQQLALISKEMLMMREINTRQHRVYTENVPQTSKRLVYVKTDKGLCTIHHSAWSTFQKVGLPCSRWCSWAL